MSTGGALAQATRQIRCTCFKEDVAAHFNQLNLFVTHHFSSVHASRTDLIQIQSGVQDGHSSYNFQWFEIDRKFSLSTNTKTIPNR